MYEAHIQTGYHTETDANYLASTNLLRFTVYLRGRGLMDRDYSKIIGLHRNIKIGTSWNHGRRDRCNACQHGGLDAGWNEGCHGNFHICLVNYVVHDISYIVL